MLGGRYRLGAPLGEGGQGRVFEGHDTWLDRPVALKQVPTGSANVLRREFETLRAVRHPALVEALDLIDGEDTLTLVETRVVGESIQAWARWQNPREILRALAPVAHALAHLHVRGVVHGDVSPSNILVDPGGRAVLIYLGFSSRRGEGRGFAGTPGYIAPERAEHQELNAPADVWSLGGVMTSLLADWRPSGAPDEVPDTQSITPDTVKALVDECLARAPASRPSASTIARRAERLSGQVIESLDQPLTHLPLTGRGVQLGQALEILREGTSTLRIQGPRGSGKTAFLEEVEARLRLDGALVFTLSMEDRGADQVLCARLGAVAPGTPEARLLLDTDAKASERAQASVLVLDRLARERPTVLLLDDAESPNSFFLKLIETMDGRSLPGFARLVLASSRDLSRGQLLELGALDLSGVESMVEVAFAEARPSAAKRIFEVVGGMPAAVLDVLRVAREHPVDLDTLEPAMLEDFESTVVPNSLAPVFLADGVLPAEVIATLVEDEPAAALLAEREGWIQPIPGMAAFRVPRSVREGWQLDDPGPAYEALGDAYEIGGFYADAAVAYAGAGQVEAWRACLTQLQDPRERGDTIRRVAHIVGLDVFDDDALVEFGRQSADGGDVAQAYDVADVLLQRGDERQARLIRGRASVANGRYADALAALEGLEGEPEDRARLARAMYFAGRSSDALALVEEIEGALSGEALVLARDIAGHAMFTLGNPEAGVSWLEASLDAAKELGNPRVVARANHSLAIALHRSSEYDRAHELYEASLEADNPLLATTLNLNFATLLHDRGRFEEARARYEVALARAEQLGNFRERARAGVNCANVLVTLGELAEAQELAESTARLCVEHDLKQAETMANLVLVEARIESERYEGAREALKRVRVGLGRIDDAVAAAEAALLDARILVREGAPGMALTRLRGLEVPNVGNLQARRALELAYAAVEERSVDDRLTLTVDAVNAADALGEEAQWRARALYAWVLIEQGDPAAVDASKHAHTLYDAFLSTLSERARGAYASTRSRSRLRERSRPRVKMIGVGEEPPSQTVEVSSSPRSYRRLLALNRQLAREPNVDSLLERIVDAAIELLGAERGFILLETEQKVRVAVARNLDRRSLEGSALRFSRSIANDVFTSGEPVVTTNAQSDARYAGAVSVAATQIRAALCVPLRGIARDEDPLIGALYLDHRFQDRVFSIADVELCASFADQATIALEGARLLAQIRAQEKSLEEQNRVLEELNHSLQRDAARAAEAAEAAIRRLREEGPTLGVGRGLEGIVGQSDGLRQALRFVDRFADTDVPVAVVGESGVGKELIARALHERSDRADRAFVSVNCGAIPESLIESELFGHVRGAFTGAHRNKPGLFAAARGGTLFLDEIAEMPLAMQVKLLRVLQESEFRPVGGTEVERSTARIVAATHRDLQQRVREGCFREDLFYRLNVVEIRVPPLRERREDLPLLVEHFCRTLTEKSADELFSEEALQRLFAYHWPGNVRELQNEVQRALALSDGRVDVADLSERLQMVRSSRAQAVATQARGSLKEIMDRYEKEVILLALERSHWNVRQTAKELGLSRAALYTRMTKFEITRQQYAVESTG